MFCWCRAVWRSGTLRTLLIVLRSPSWTVWYVAPLKARITSADDACSFIFFAFLFYWNQRHCTRLNHSRQFQWVTLELNKSRGTVLTLIFSLQFVKMWQTSLLKHSLVNVVDIWGNLWVWFTGDMVYWIFSGFWNFDQLLCLTFPVGLMLIVV